jgi:hypothetical protein
MITTGNRVRTPDGTATITEIDNRTHVFCRYHLHFDEPDPFCGYDPWVDEEEIIEVICDKMPIQLTLF